MQNQEETLIDLPKGTVSVGCLSEFNIDLLMHKFFITVYKKSVKIYETLQRNNVVELYDIDRISNNEDKNYLYKLHNEVISFLPHIEYESIQDLQFPKLHEISYTDVGLKNQLLHLKDLINRYDESYELTPAELNKGQVDFNAYKKHLTTMPLENYIQRMSFQKAQKIQQLNERLVIEFFCYTNQLSRRKLRLWDKCREQNEQIIYLKKPNEWYAQEIKESSDNIEYHAKICQELRIFIDNQNPRNRLKMRNSVFQNQTIKSKSIDMKKIAQDDEKFIRINELLKRDFPEDYKKLQDECNKIDNLDFNDIVFSALIGKQCSKQAVIAYKALCSIVYREYQYGNISRLSDKVEIKSSDLWTLCNIKKNQGGFDSRSKTKFKDSIEQELQAKIIYEDQNEYYCTSFLMSFFYNKKNNKIVFAIEDLFLVSNNSENYSYYYSDLEGCNRLMDATNNSDKAYWLHHYLEYSLKSNKQEFNLTLLLEKSQLSDKYFTQRKKSEALKDLNNIMSKMVAVKTLIYDYKHVNSASDRAGKYILYNLRTKKKKIENYS